MHRLRSLTGGWNEGDFIKNTIAAATLLVLALGFAPAARALNWEDIPGNSFTPSSAAAPAPAPAQALPARKVKEWTVMVFINAKNNLELSGLYNVNDMETVGSDDKVNIVVELGRMNGQAGDTDADGDWTGSRRLYIKKDADMDKITSPVVNTSPVVDMGDYKRVVDFVAWAKKTYPARKYMLVLWDHGAGWLDPLRQINRSGKGISFDDETNNYIRTRQIGSILKEAGKVDVLAYDACLMQMGEVAFEVKDNASVLLGSEEAVPGAGYPYGLILGALAERPAIGAEELGSLAVDYFKRYYDAAGVRAQLSAIRSSKLAGLGVKTAEFAALAREVNDREALKAARTGVIRYDIFGANDDPDMKLSFYGDLYQYAGLVANGLAGTDVKTAALKARTAELQEYIDNEVVINNKASGYNRIGHELSESHGLSVYLPPADLRAVQLRVESINEMKYTAYQFDKAVKWHDFVTYLYGVK